MQIQQQSGIGARDFASAFRAIFTAEPRHIDELGHVNNVVYLDWAQHIAIAHWRHVAPLEMQTGSVWVAVRHEIDYRDAVLEGETVEARTWLGEVSGAKFARHIDLRKPGAARFSARVLTWWAWLDAETRRPKRVGDDVLAAFGLAAGQRG